MLLTALFCFCNDQKLKLGSEYKKRQIFISLLLSVLFCFTLWLFIDYLAFFLSISSVLFPTFFLECPHFPLYVNLYSLFHPFPPFLSFLPVFSSQYLLFFSVSGSTWTSSPSSAPHWPRAELPQKLLAEGERGVPSALLAGRETLKLAPYSLLTCSSTLKMQAQTLCTVCCVCVCVRFLEEFPSSGYSEFNRWSDWLTEFFTHCLHSLKWSDFHHIIHIMNTPVNTSPRSVLKTFCSCLQHFSGLKMFPSRGALRPAAASDLKLQLILNTHKKLQCFFFIFYSLHIHLPYQWLVFRPTFEGRL